jgi:hypothetical protein
MRTTKNLEKFQERKEKKKSKVTVIQTSYFLFHIPDPNFSSTIIVGAGRQYFCLLYSYLYNTTPPNIAPARTNPAIPQPQPQANPRY